MGEIKKKYNYIYLFINDIEYIYDIDRKEYYIYNNHFDKKQIFYFIDNGHITGVNIPVPTLSHFLVTTIDSSLLRDVHQGIYRQRLIGYCQYVTIIINDNTNNIIDNTNNIIDNTNNAIDNTNNIIDKCTIINKWQDNEMNKERANIWKYKYLQKFGAYKNLEIAKNTDKNPFLLFIELFDELE